MKRLGLTGGIASGKSFVASLLRDLGFRVLDADRLAHELSEPGAPGFPEIVGEFGRDILDASGGVDRAKLGAIVFADRAKLEKLNAILHPLVGIATNQQFDAWEKEGVRDAAFVEAALLVEAGMHKQLDGLVVTWCTPEQQLERLRERGLTEAEARRRISLQMPQDQKLKYATERIDCSGTQENTRQQVEALAAKLRGHHSQPGAGT